MLEFKVNSHVWCRPRWPRGLRSGSAAVRLLGLRVRIPPVARMFVSYGYCMCCQEVDSERGRSLVRRSLTECGVSECDLETSTMRRPRPTRAAETWNKSHVSWVLINSWTYLTLFSKAETKQNFQKMYISLKSLPSCPRTEYGCTWSCLLRMH